LWWCAGNEYIHQLTTKRRQHLRVVLGDLDGNRAYAEYDKFKVGSEREQYKLTSLGDHSGTAGRYDCKLVVRVRRKNKIN